MKRRAFLLGTSALLMQGRGVVAPAAAPAPATSAMPYAEVSPVGEDARRCIAFFQFGCPHCRDLHPALVRWGRSLPRGVGFEFMPVLAPAAPLDRGQVMAARAWYAVAQAAPSRLEAFAESAYALVQDGRMRMETGATWEAAARQAGVGDFARAWERVRVDRIGRAMEKLAAYRIQSTPSLAIAGRYVVTLDDTQGDAELFLRLASGLLSKTLS
jgi:thiol:disulfide interchange protein DsbA